jgi:hypothetical protein
MDFSVEDLPRAFGSDLLEVEWEIPFCKSLKEVEGHKSSSLPSVEKYTLQEEFADVYMGVSKTEFFAIFDVQSPLEKTLYPEFKKGDAIELIIDTNPSKMQSVTTRFVHHFVFLPLPYEGIFAKEITRFRGNETRGLVNDEELRSSVHQSKNHYKISISISLNALYGISGSLEKKKALGIGYRVHRFKGEVQEFPHNGQSMHFDVHPNLLATGLLT